MNNASKGRLIREDSIDSEIKLKSRANECGKDSPSVGERAL